MSRLPNEKLFAFGKMGGAWFCKSDEDKFNNDEWLHDIVIDLHSDLLWKWHIATNQEKCSVQILDTGMVQIIKEAPLNPEIACFGPAHGGPCPELDAHHVFVPVNNAVPETDEEGNLLADSGTHWSFLHILRRSLRAEPVAVRHYDSTQEGLNNGVATDVMHCIAGIYGWPSWAQSSGTNYIEHVRGIPTTDNGDDCGLALTWMLRELVLKIKDGQPLWPEEHDSAWKMGAKTNFNAAAERRFFEGAIRGLIHFSVRHLE
jgi:hypothetical protein